MLRARYLFFVVAGGLILASGCTDENSDPSLPDVALSADTFCDGLNEINQLGAYPADLPVSEQIQIARDQAGRWNELVALSPPELEEDVQEIATATAAMVHLFDQAGSVDREDVVKVANESQLEMIEGSDAGESGARIAEWSEGRCP